MKTNVLLFFTFISFQSICPQDLSKLQVVESGLQLVDEIVSSEKRDINGEVCAGLLVLSDLSGLNFKSFNGIVDLNKDPGRDFLFLSPSERVVEIYKDGFEPLKIILIDYGIKLQSGQVWQIKITGDKKLELIPVNIITNIKGAEIYIDGKSKGTGTTFQITEGEHELRIEKDGFRSINKKINISALKNLFNFTLQQLDPVKTTIKSIPTSAKIKLDGIDKGLTERDLFLFPGSYSLQLSKSGYLDINESIIVSSAGNNEFNYQLVKNSVTLTINVNPVNAKVLINKEDYSNKNKIELAPGRYLIEVSKEGFNEKNEYIELALGEPITKTFTLEQKTGILQLTVQPVDAFVSLKSGVNIIKSWTGSKIQKNIGAGDYTLEVTKEGYTAQTLTIQIKENQTTIKDIILTQDEATPATLTAMNGMQMIFVKGGTFQMGSNNGDSDEKPVHTVTVNDFYIGKYEVTQKEWKEIMSNNPSRFKGDNLPVENVSWNNIQEFIKKFNQKTGDNCRLPTEAEWEYAARGGNKSRGYKYSGSNNLTEVAWYNTDIPDNKTHEVGTKKPNKLGIYDMSGNVWEWCNDWYSSSYYNNSPQANPKGPTSGKYKVLRGGSLYNITYDCRVTNRLDGLPDGTDDHLGFRCAMTK